MTERLYNTATLTGSNEARFNEAAKAYSACWKDFAIAKVLFQYASSNAATLMNRVLKQSLKYQFPKLIVEVCGIQRIYFANVNQNRKKYAYYNDLLTFRNRKVS